MPSSSGCSAALDCCAALAVVAVRGSSAAYAVRAAVRVLALDYGSARCGAALSDPTGTLATPIEPVLRPDTRKGLRRVVEIVETMEVERVVVGLPLSLSGGDSAQTRDSRAWAERLSKQIRVPVELHDERFTTKLAQDLGGDAAEDSRAAAVLLDSWLATRANRSSPPA